MRSLRIPYYDQRTKRIDEFYKSYRKTMKWSKRREFDRKYNDVNYRYDKLQAQCEEWMDGLKISGDHKTYRRYFSLWRKLNIRRYYHQDLVLRIQKNGGKTTTESPSN